MINPRGGTLYPLAPFNGTNYMNDIPYLESERHFRRYESFVKQIVLNWPQVTVFTPTPPIASTETLSSRIRMAIKSLRDHQWAIDWGYDKFIQCCDEIVVSLTVQQGKVVCGPFDLVRKATPLGTPIACVDTQLVPKIDLINPPEELIHAIVVFHHHRLLTEPSRITTQKNMEVWIRRYDVSVNKEGDTYTIL